MYVRVFARAQSCPDHLISVQAGPCVGSTKPLRLKKACRGCSEEVTKPPELPEDSVLVPGETVVKAGGELTTKIAVIA
jgi:hypothetical protein